MIIALISMHMNVALPYSYFTNLPYLVILFCLVVVAFNFKLKVVQCYIQNLRETGLLNVFF